MRVTAGLPRIAAQPTLSSISPAASIPCANFNNIAKVNIAQMMPTWCE
jgi:hypothetical protein